MGFRDITHISDAGQTLPSRSSVCGGILDNSPFLPVEATDVNKAPGSGFVVGNELRGDGEFLRGVDRERRPWTKVLGLAHRVGIEATSPLIADAVESALFALATINTFDAARMRSESCGPPVTFPDVHFIAACSEGVGVDRAVEPEIEISRNSDFWRIFGFSDFHRSFPSYQELVLKH